MRTQLCRALLLASLTAVDALGDPYLPANRSEVVFVLPHAARQQNRPQIVTLRRQMQARPQDVGVACALTDRLVRLARSDGDPSLLGQAQAVLGPWWQVEDAPAELLVLRAVLKQASHGFAGAVNDLHLALRSEPGNVQAWLLLAGVHTVQADYALASRACLAAHRLGAGLPAIATTALVGSMTGRGALAMEQLERSLAAAGAAAPADQRAWSLTLLGEMASRFGQIAQAPAYFHQALELAPEDAYLLGAYADCLLDQQRAAEVVSLLGRRTGNTGLLLRLALAEREQSGSAARAPRLDAHLAELASRFAAARLRGDEVHLREEARYTLEFANDATKATELARRNWSVQREPIDARVLLEAALASGNLEAARPVLDWITTNSLEDVRLRDLHGRFPRAHPAQPAP